MLIVNNTLILTRPQGNDLFIIVLPPNIFATLLLKTLNIFNTRILYLEYISCNYRYEQNNIIVLIQNIYQSKQYVLYIIYVTLLQAIEKKNGEKYNKML